MNKSHQLRQFAQLATTLSFNAVRLYLLFLAGAKASGKGRLTPALLQQALGRSPRELKGDMQVLVDAGLVELLSPAASPDCGSSLDYRLLPINGGAI